MQDLDTYTKQARVLHEVLQAECLLITIARLQVFSWYARLLPSGKTHAPEVSICIMPVRVPR